ncbi:MAG: translation initiation factor IF-2 [Treponema sp.]|nr:translation initiation factor IF-2 [Treponema sp.]
MAEEMENTQKPKAELIKRTQSEGDGSSRAAPGGGSQRNVGGEAPPRKIIVVKKKSPQRPGTARKPQPKVVVHPAAPAARIAPEGDAADKQKPVASPTMPPVSEGSVTGLAGAGREDTNGTAKSAAGSALVSGAVRDDAVKNDAAGAAVARDGAARDDAAKTDAVKTGAAKDDTADSARDDAVKTGAAGAAVAKIAVAKDGVAKDGVVKTDVAKTDAFKTGAGEGRPQKPAERSGGFTITARPAGAAGRVGGRPVGRRDDGNRSGGFTPRPAGAAGRVGGRPVGHDRPGFNGPPRPAGPPSGPRPQGRFGPPGAGQRPGGPGRPPFTGQRPGGPGRPPFTGQRPGGPGRPGGSTAPMPETKTTAKRTFKAKKPVYTRKEKELEMEEKLLQTKKKITHIANPVPKSIEIMEGVSVSELARKMNLKASDLIQKLMSMGMMVTINQQIDADTATILAGEYGTDVKIISLYDETQIETISDAGAELKSRPPVVTIMGHVDHGKTKLLDAIRSTDVVSGEFGGITQHIGAYTVATDHGNITFLDTPGHEAFTRMRARGAQVTDIVVLVVAADDGVMPQTIEAINHAKEADVPIIVAVNKIDKPEANPDRVKSQLSDIGLMPEDWGGQTMFVEISALQNEGIDKLIEAILLQAEILNLKANYDRSAEGKVLESRIDHGRGIVATILVEKGTLAVGDSFVAGVWPGKVRAIFDDKGNKLEEAGPSMPVEVLGFEGIPNAGDPLQVVNDEKIARGFSSKRQELKRFEDAKNVRKITLDNLQETINEGTIQELKVIIKSDVQGSAEALRSSLEELSSKEVRLHVIQALPGAINEGDVDLAAASNAIIIGFNVRPVAKARALADQEKVDIRRYNVIYKAVDEIKLAMEGMLKPLTREDVIATVEVRNTFSVPKVGTIAGCYVLTGTVKRSCSVNVIRNDTVIRHGKIASLKRFKDDAREVAAGYECGIGIEDFNDIKVGDQLEILEIVEVARKLSPTVKDGE